MSEKDTADVTAGHFISIADVLGEPWCREPIVDHLEKGSSFDLPRLTCFLGSLGITRSDLRTLMEELRRYELISMQESEEQLTLAALEGPCEELRARYRAEAAQAAAMAAEEDTFVFAAAG